MKTEAPSNSNRNVEWAVETFRPLLKDLHLQKISKDSPTIIKTADFRNLIVKGMGRCIIAVQRQVISDGQSGYCTFIYNKEYELYILSIVVDENLFNNDSLDFRTKRKALGIHEFVHCVAILMSISLLGTGSNPLIERLKSILAEKLTVTTSDDFTQLFKALGTIAENNDSQNISLFSDKHFRTGFEDFPDDYADLYLNFLFSYKLLKEIINFERMETFKNLLLAKDSKMLVSFLNDIVNEIVENKALDRNFVMQRFCYFLPRLSRELLQI